MDAQWHSFLDAYFRFGEGGFPDFVENLAPGPGFGHQATRASDKDSLVFAFAQEILDLLELLADPLDFPSELFTSMIEALESVGDTALADDPRYAQELDRLIDASA